MSDIARTVQLLSVIMQIGMNGKQKAVPFMLQGPPGVGKTVGLGAIADAIGKALRIKYIAEIWSGPQIQAEDASGLPVPDLEAGWTRLLPIRIGASVMNADGGVVALDEFGSITNAQEAAFLNFLQGGRLGELQLPETISRGAMMNPEDIASNGRILSPPAANRFAWLDWELPYNVWCDYMKGGEGFAAYISVLGEDWDRLIPVWRSIFAAYISRNPSELLKMPPPHQASCAWKSPRSWENSAILCAATESTGVRKTSDLIHQAVGACVGDGGADEFITWLSDANLPDPEMVLADPENKQGNWKMPDRPDQRAITVDAVAIAATQKDHQEFPKRWESAWKVVGPIFQKENDVALTAAKQLASVDPPKGVQLDTIPVIGQIRDILVQSGLALPLTK